MSPVGSMGLGNGPVEAFDPREKGPFLDSFDPDGLESDPVILAVAKMWAPLDLLDVEMIETVGMKDENIPF